MPKSKGERGEQGRTNPAALVERLIDKGFKTYSVSGDEKQPSEIVLPSTRHSIPDVADPTALRPIASGTTIMPGDERYFGSSYLYAVVQAGPDELFGIEVIAGVHSRGERDITVVRFMPDGSPAKIIGCLSNQLNYSNYSDKVMLGRTHQEGLSPTTSRNHLSIGVSSDVSGGHRLRLLDSGSMHGTEVTINTGEAQKVTGDDLYEASGYDVFVPRFDS